MQSTVYHNLSTFNMRILVFTLAVSLEKEYPRTQKLAS